MSSTRIPPTTVAIVGSSISLPQNVDTREKLFELVRDKRQVSSDHVESGRYRESDVEVGRHHPWKLQNRFSNAFRAVEREEFDTAFFHVPGKVTRNMQIEQCCVLQAAYEAVEDSGITLQQLHNTTTGVFVAGYCTFLAAPNAPDETNMRGQIMSTLADQVAYFLGTHGPTVTLETACSSSLVAVALAVSALQKGDCDLAIVVGNNSLTHKDFHLSLQACGVLVEGPASYPFDEDAPKGFLRCEGTGAMVLRRTSEAVEQGDRILAEIVGAIAASAGSADGCTEGAGRVYEQPCAKGMREMFKRCTTTNGIATSDIDYMECHATGTAVGDVIELEAVGAVYGEAHTSHNPLRVASIKSNIGHAEIAAGIFSLTKAVEMLRKRVFLPTAGVTKPRSDFDWAGHNMRVQQTVEPFPNDKKVIIAVSSFGIGGSYGHCLVREWRPEDYLQGTASEASSPKKPLIKASSSKKALALAERPRAPPAVESSYQLLPLSGFSLAHLKQYAVNMAAYLRAKPTVRLADVCGTVALRRSRFPFRKAFVASSTEDLASQLETFAASGSADAIGEARTLRTAFILTGQGSQWAKNGVELMDSFPIYRKAAETIDKQFTALAGWSLLDKINTLSTDDMRETKFAQPITFMVQVALLETLKHFSVFPDVVIGHSAGEVTAAYAAGLLTLEEAVQVVYHRSSEQQKLAGTGRMLAIGLGSEEVMELIKGKPALELACMNSPSSSVVAGPEDQLTALKESLPQGTSSTFIPGNIAFHSSRCQPILESMKKRLAFLDSHVSTAGWSVPLVSTVSGKVVTATPPQYWADNVRHPVLFQRAIETAFNMEPAPEVVIEIGPHRTLVGPAQQTIQGMEGKAAKVVSILNRKESNTLTVLQTLGTMFESGVNLNFGLYFKDDVNYKFEEELPKHPYMKKNIRQGLYPVIFHEANVSDMNAGPAAGSHRTFSDTFVIELCDRTAKAMCNHKMGGEAVVAGGFYSEMALEANGQLPVTLVNMEFKAKLSIPKSSAGDNASFVVLNFKEEQDNMRSFTITSCPSRDKYHERPVHVEHCSGKVVKHNPLDENDNIIPGPVPEAHGIMGKLKLEDIGKEGLAAMQAAHCECEHSTKDSFYETYAQEGRNEYIDNYKLTTGLWVDPLNATVMSRIEYDNSMWEKEKGFYAVELLDNMTHQSLYSTFVNVIYYAGGYEAAHFLRTPSTTTLWALWRPDPYMTQVGRKKMSGDFLLYDDNGKLCVHIHKYFCMFIIQGDTYKLCTLDWQYANLVTPQAVLSKSLETAVVKGLDAWGPSKNRAMTAWLAKQLAARGIVTLGSGETPLNLTALAANASSGAITLPAAAKLAERIDAVLDALVKKLKKSDKDEEATPEKEAKVVELDDNLMPEEEKEDVEFNEDEMADLRSFGSLARAEADAVAEALLALAQAEQKAHSAEPVQAVGIGNAPFVLRVLEIAQESVTTGFERLSYMDLPAHLRVEYFVASHSAKTLKGLVRNFNRRCKNVVLRRVLLPSGRAPTTVLKDMTFHAVIFDDWVKSGSAAWAPEEEEAEEAKSVGSVLTPAANALALLRPFLAPSAQVMVRGMASEPVWIDILSQISTKPNTVPDSTKAEADETLKEACAAAAKEWNTALETVGAKGVQQTSDLLLLGALPATFDVSAGRYIVIASDDEQVQAVRKAALAAAGSAVELDVVMMDDSTTVESLVETLSKVLKASAAAGVKVEELSDEDSGVEETKSSDSNPRRAKAEDSHRVKGLLFTAALNDTSVIGEDGFSRLLRLSQALMKCEEGLTLHLSPAGEGPSLWVLTQGVYGGDLRPNQGSLQGLTTVLYSELRLVNVKLCDMSTKADMSMAVELTLSRAREQSYRVDKGNVRVARFCGLNRDELKACEVMPSSKKNFFVDTSAGELVLKRATPHPLGVMTAFYRLRELPPPGDDEVTIDIHAAALNFRDVMVALNMLAEKSFEASYYGKNLGLEAAGIVSAVGKNVKNLKVGDPVMCGEPRCFANRLNAPADRVVPLSTGDKELDASMTKEQRETSLVKAAATQSVYNTCHHSLINLARIRKGERVLIHAAAGGVGHAAISICKYMGAVIYATAGTPEKRQLVKDMGVDFVYDSRSTSWFSDVMRDTNNEGVDVVLNSLAGLHQRLGVQALRSSGRFLEIGKMDIYDNASLGLIVFRKNISFFAIDMDRLALDDPAMSADVAREVGKRIQAGDYHSLPTKLFPMGQLREALEYMKSGKHVGKVVLVNYDEKGTEIPTTVGLDSHVFRPDITYLITGAAGGFGAKLIRYAFIQGARHFIITTRNPNVADTMARFRYIVEDSGVTIQVVVADTAKEEDIKKMLDVARKCDPPCKAIYHLAGISGDVKVGDMKDREDFEKVALCKAKGAWMLSDLSKDMGLEQFVTVSSISALIGGMGNAAYAAANAFQDALVRYRRAQGLPATTFNMSSLSDAGILVKNLQARRFQMKMGVEYMTAQKAMEEIELGMQANLSPVVTMFFKEQTRHMFPSQAAWSHLLDEQITLGISGGKSGPMSMKEVAAFLAEEIKSITQASEVLVTSSLVSLGLDSFGFVELGGRIQKQFNIDINSVKLTPEQTLMEVANLIFKLQKRQEGATTNGENGEGVEEEAEAEALASSAAMGVMMKSRFDAVKEVRSTASLLKKSVSARILTEPSSLLSKTPSAYVLFGATGLMGSHVLRYIIKSGAKKVYCIVRAATDEAAFNRIVSCMSGLRIWKPEFADAIVPLAGDLLKEDFGLKPAAYETLVAEVAHVVHAAGSRAWHMDVTAIDCNTKGVMNCVGLARKNGAAVHYVSSSWLDVYDAAQSDEDRAELNELPYMGIKRRGEEILRYAAKNCDVRCYNYRVPLLSVNSKGGFFGDFILLTAIQGMINTGVGPDVKGLFPIQTTDSAAKFMVRTMKTVPLDTKGKAPVYTSLPYAELVAWETVADMAEQMRPGHVRRNTSRQDYVDAMAAIIPRQLLEGSGASEFAAALERATAHLRVHAKPKKLSEQMAIALAKRKEKQPASVYFKDYVRRKPEVITHGSFTALWQQALERRKREEAEAEATRQAEEAAKAPAVQVQ